MIDVRINGQNPGNLENSDAYTWKGQIVPKVGRFAQYISLEYGTRAMFKDMRNKITEGKDSIQKIISAWCPPPEAGGDCTNTSDYINFVSHIAGVAPVQTLIPSDQNTLTKIATAIAQMEHGVTLDPSLLSVAWNMQFSNEMPPAAPAVQPPVIVAAGTAQEPAAGSTDKSNTLLWFGGGLAALGGLYLLSKQQ